jgi:hypothetical protein
MKRHQSQTAATLCAIVVALGATGTASARPIDVGGPQGHVGRDNALAVRAFAAKQPRSSYGALHTIPASTPRSTDDAEWPIVGLVAAGGTLLVLGSGTVIRKIRVRRGTTGITAG